MTRILQQNLFLRDTVNLYLFVNARIDADNDNDGNQISHYTPVLNNYMYHIQVYSSNDNYNKNDDATRLFIKLINIYQYNLC